MEKKQRGATRLVGIAMLLALGCLALGYWFAARKVAGGPARAPVSAIANGSAAPAPAPAAPEKSASPIAPSAAGGVAPAASSSSAESSAQTPTAPSQTQKVASRPAAPWKAQPESDILSSSGPVIRAQPQSSSAAPAAERAAKSLDTWQVSGQVLQTRDYCGGANPSEEILEELRKEKPYPSKELFVKAGSENSLANPVLQSFTTDADGRFEISLPPGDYCIVEGAKKDALKIPDFTEENKKLATSRSFAEPYRLTSPKCLPQWWATCDKTVHVEKQNLSGVHIVFHHTCLPPCVTGGPMPQ